MYPLRITTYIFVTYSNRCIEFVIPPPETRYRSDDPPGLTQKTGCTLNTETNLGVFANHLAIYIFLKKKYVNKIKQNYKNCSSSWISKVYIPSFGRWPLSELNHWWHIEFLFAKKQWSFSQYFRTHLHEEKKWILWSLHDLRARDFMLGQYGIE